MSKQNIIITLLSDDKPGVVQTVADIIAKEGGNWLESRMSQLAGKFAGILKVSIDKDKVQTLTSSLQGLDASGIQVLIDEAGNGNSEPNAKTLAFELMGADRVGIVSEIANAFSAKGISIDDLETQCSSMPWSGEPLFEASGILIAPDTIDKENLLNRLDEIEDKLGLDISITEQL